MYLIGRGAAIGCPPPHPPLSWDLVPSCACLLVVTFINGGYKRETLCQRSSCFSPPLLIFDDCTVKNKGLNREINYQFNIFSPRSSTELQDTRQEIEMTAVADRLGERKHAAGDSAPYWDCFQLN